MMSIKQPQQRSQPHTLRLNKETLRDLAAPYAQALQVNGGRCTFSPSSCANSGQPR